LCRFPAEADDDDDDGEESGRQMCFDGWAELSK
jgi:hypothetical protein